MELPLTPQQKVTPLAVVRAIRKVSLKTLATQLGVAWQDIRDWERGEASIPSTATYKRLGLALRWPWQELAAQHLDPQDAWDKLLKAKKRIAEYSHNTPRPAEKNN